MTPQEECEREDCEEEGVLPDNIPVQGVFDPVSGQNITGDFVSESRDDLDQRLDAILALARDKIDGGASPDAVYSEFIIVIEEELIIHYRRLKLPLNTEMLARYTRELSMIIGVEP